MGNELVLREPKTKEITGLSKSTRHRLMKLGLFPLKVRLGPRASGWIAAEVIDWLAKRAAAR
jgi:prophage regulatory protein